MINKTWKDNNLLLKYGLLQEADRSRFINSNPNLTPEQKEELISLFKKFTNLGGDIKWGSKEVNNWTYENFMPYLSQAGKSITQSKKQKTGIEGSGLELGKDYLVLYQDDKVTAYQPLTYYASRIIASNDTPPAVIGVNRYKNKITGAEWCISYQKDRAYWDRHSINSKEVFIMLCGENIPTKKVCITASREKKDADGSRYSYHSKESNLYYNIWDFNNKKNTVKPEELKNFINVDNLISRTYNNYNLVLENHNRDVQKTEEIIRQKTLSKLKFNKETGRYDCLDPSEVDFEYLIKDCKFVYPLGVWNGDFYCYNIELTSLEGAPQEINGSFNCYHNNLTSLKGAPQKVVARFDCSNNQLTSLEGAPKYVGGDFNCENSHLTSLKGAPQEVGGYFNCSNNQLTSLKGAPQKVGRCFNCTDNLLTSLEGAPQEVGGDFYCKFNPDYPFTDDPYRPEYFKG